MNTKLRTKTGLPIRKEYSFFEWEAITYAAQNHLQSGDIFIFGSSNENFRVATNTDSEISVWREKTSKLIEAVKFEKTERVPRQPRQPKETQTQTDIETETQTQTGQQQTESKDMENTAIQATLQQLTNLLMQQSSGVDMAKIEAMIDEKIKSAKTIEIIINGVKSFETEKVLHDKFSDVLFWATQRQPVYLYGPAGTGKNVLAEQIAEAMGLQFYYAGCLQQKYELEGFINAAGEYQETEFYRAFTHGGVFLFDEIDGTAAEVLIAFNAALANGYYNFPKHGRTKAHPDFVVLAAGNTTGRGASDAYNGRFQLDASTLDRFAFVSLTYNKEIEIWKHLTLSSTLKSQALITANTTHLLCPK